jgi:hypothetical protein
LAKRMRIDDYFTPCPVTTEDELFANGLFVFNITKMIEYVKENPDSVTLEEVAVSDFSAGLSSINESHMGSVEMSQPVIVAEISPGRYNLIDGNHRMEKAFRMGIRNMLAYKLTPEQHTRFLTSKKAYIVYIEYWNSKLK